MVLAPRSMLAAGGAAYARPVVEHAAFDMPSS